MTNEEASLVLDNARPETAEYDKGFYDDEDLNTAINMAMEALKGGWIPITEGEKLPEHDVICCDNEGNIALGYLYFDEEENQIACDHDPYVMFGIVAYMELPKPYKEGGE